MCVIAPQNGERKRLYLFSGSPLCRRHVSASTANAVAGSRWIRQPRGSTSVKIFFIFDNERSGVGARGWVDIDDLARTELDGRALVFFYSVIARELAHPVRENLRILAGLFWFHSDFAERAIMVRAAAPSTAVDELKMAALDELFDHGLNRPPAHAEALGEQSLRRRRQVRVPVQVLSEPIGNAEGVRRELGVLADLVKPFELVLCEDGLTLARNVRLRCGEAWGGHSAVPLQIVGLAEIIP
nr:hypothetical protein [Microvirga aerophila]